MNRPEITVIVPTYNDGDMLIQALESIRTQTFSDYEVIVGDDCSTNNTAELATEFCKQDARFRVVGFSDNVGMTDNWNRLAKEARGDFICKLDGDDAYQPDHLAKLYSALQEHKTDIAFCRTIDCDDQLQPVSSYYGERALILNQIEPLKDVIKQGSEWYRVCFDGYQLWHSNAFLIKRTVFEELGGWDNRWGCAADTDIILRMLERDEPVCSCSYPGVLYRRRKGSVLDTYRTRSWHRLESCVVMGLSLERMRTKKQAYSWHLKRRWVQIWAVWKRESQVVLQAPNEFQDLKATTVSLPSPPLSYRLLSGVRDGGTLAKRLLKQLTLRDPAKKT